MNDGFSYEARIFMTPSHFHRPQIRDGDTSNHTLLNYATFEILRSQFLYMSETPEAFFFCLYFSPTQSPLPINFFDAIWLGASNLAVVLELRQILISVSSQRALTLDVDSENSTRP